MPFKKARFSPPMKSRHIHATFLQPHEPRQKPSIARCVIRFVCVKMAEEQASPAEPQGSFLSHLINEIVQSPLNIALVFLMVFLVYKITKNRRYVPAVAPPEPELPRLRRDFTVQELKVYDGTGPDGRVLVAVNGSVYDVTKGKRFYGPGGPYAAFGGKDASRGLATFDVSAKADEYDDLSDLNTMEMDSVREWEAQFKEKYILVGRLLKPGEEPNSYSDEEDEVSGEKQKEEEPKSQSEKKDE